jgi:hypothetical protein
LTAIKKPQITEVALNTTVSNLGNITVAFNTGPNLPGTTFSVKCVAGTQGCNGPAAGDGEVTSPLPLKSSYVEADVTNVLLGGNNTYQCFVSASAGKFSKCIEAVTDVAPSPPANVVATASGLCTPAIDVSWQAPGSGRIVTEYVITCVSSTSAPSSATVPGSATTASVAVLTGVEYQCSVFSNGPSGTSSSVAASPVAYEYVVDLFKHTMRSYDSSLIVQESEYYAYAGIKGAASLFAAMRKVLSTRFTHSSLSKMLKGGLNSGEIR